MSVSSLQWNGQTLVFLPEKALWVEQQRLMLIADVHLGKADHLQAHGIAIPSDGERANLERIAQLSQRWQPAELIVLGDLVHHPKAVSGELEERVLALLGSLNCPITWVEGNHDRRRRLGQLQGQPSLSRQGLWLSHEPEIPPEGQLNICGHLHPVSILRQTSDQMRLPCFSLVRSIPRLVLPAFGCLTGGFPADRSSEQWVVADETVLPLPNGSPRRRAWRPRA